MVFAPGNDGDFREASVLLQLFCFAGRRTMKRSIKDVMGHLFKLVSESANQDLSILSECAGILERFAHVPELGKNARLLRDFSDSLRSKQFPAAVKALSTAYDAGCSYDCKDCLRCQQIFYMLLYKKYILERDPDGKLIPPEWYKYSPADFKTMELQPLREELGELFRRQSQPRDYYKLLPKRLPGSSRPDNFFINLKGMSSSSPFMYNSALHTNYVGGGFYVRWEGVGIAVDPGYNFLKNLRDHSLTVYDIDIVIITHDHIDHNHDVRLLTDMAYHLEKTNSIHWYTDTETAQQLKRYLGDAYQETVHLVSGSYPTLIGLNRLALNDRIVLHPFRTNHILSDTARDAGEGLKYNDSSFGFVLELTDKSSGKYQIGYTSDTSFFPELPVNLNGVDLLIANISSVYQEELVEEKQNDLHLGLLRRRVRE